MSGESRQQLGALASISICKLLPHRTELLCVLLQHGLPSPGKGLELPPQAQLQLMLVPSHGNCHQVIILSAVRLRLLSW